MKSFFIALVFCTVLDVLVTRTLKHIDCTKITSGYALGFLAAYGKDCITGQRR